MLALESGKARQQFPLTMKSWAEADTKKLADYPAWCDCMDSAEDRDFMKRMLNDRNALSAEKISELHTGDACVFTQALAERCQQQGAQLMYGHDIVRLNKTNTAIESVVVYARINGATDLNDTQKEVLLKADAMVLACGSYSEPLLRRVGVNLPIYPGKGYSATFKILRPELAPQVSTIDDEVKCAMSRLGDQLRVAGTIELGGYDLSLTSPLAQARCAMLARRVEEVLPGVRDTRLESEGGTLTFGPACALPHPPTSPTLAKPGSKSCGSTLVMARWAGRTAQGQARLWPSW